MSWENVKPLRDGLAEALDAFDWSLAEQIVQLLIRKIHAEPKPLPEGDAGFFLKVLRRKRQFRLMALLADALLHSGQRAPLIRRQYAQALIDQGLLTAPELLLNSIIQDAQGTFEETEARGLVGRIYKQLYVNIGDSHSQRNRLNMARSLHEYMYVYRLDAQENVWHGINVVALLHRARRDGIPPPQGFPTPEELAGDVLAAMPARWQQEIERTRQRHEPPPAHMPAFDVATALEALLALGRYSEAQMAAIEYAGLPDADEFEFASTLRQMEEVWQLDDKSETGSWLLPILRAARLRRKGSFLNLQPDTVRAELASIQRFIRDFDPEQVAPPPWYAENREAQVSAARDAGTDEKLAQMGYEKKFIQDGTATVRWMETGLKRSMSVARVDDANARGHGTGWLVNASDFYPGREGLLLLTNAHVVSEKKVLESIKPTEARISFKEAGTVFAVEPQVVWSSPIREYDATLLAFKGDPPQIEPLPIAPERVAMPDPNEQCDPPKLPPRLYIIGYPDGGDMEYSLQDNYLISCKDHLLHYRTPTAPGSSGSPVFGPIGWSVVALHHRGKEKMERLDGKPGYYEANEGISILTIQEASRLSWRSRRPAPPAE